nr:hypothetical protein [uncultured Marinifilum sp.]
MANAQDIEQVLDSKKVQFSGSFAVNNVNYSAIGKARNREAHTFYATGNLNISLFEQWSIPLNFTYSNQDVELSHGVSFNQIGITPTYKWVKLYAGYSSMSFSPYTLNGHSFLGAGLELTPPGKWSTSVMIGRLRKAEEPVNDNKETLFSYKRMGYGLKLNYKDKGDDISIIAFGAKDDEHSVKLIPDNTEITPMENLVLGVNVRKNLFSKIFVGIELTNSMLTKDKRHESRGEKNSGVFRLTKGLMKANSTSSVYTALKTDIGYQSQDFSVSMLYERVDPEYQTLGAYYFTNDMENISITTTKQFFKGHLNISANAGLQRNDLKNEKKSQMNNVVGSVNIGIQTGAKTNLNLSYSNYTSYTNIRSDFENINEVNQKQVYDTLDFTQVSQNMSLNLSQVLGDIKNTSLRQNLNVNMNIQIASEKQEGQKSKSGNKFYSTGITHSLSWKNNGISLSSSINGNYNDMETSDALTLGPTLSVSKRFKKNLRTALSGSWNRSYRDGDFVNRIYVIRCNGAYALKKHSFNLSMNYMNRNEEKEYAEFTFSLGYNYSF